MSVLACSALPEPSHSGIRWSRWKVPQCALMPCNTAGGRKTQRRKKNKHAVAWTFYWREKARGRLFYKPDDKVDDDLREIWIFSLVLLVSESNKAHSSFVQLCEVSLWIKQVKEVGDWNYLSPLFGCCSLFRYFVDEKASNPSIAELFIQRSFREDSVPFLSPVRVHERIPVFHPHHCHQNITYVGEAKRQTDGLISLFILTTL